MNSLSLSRARHGFTLAELLVSSTIVVMMLGFLFVTVDQTRKTINNTTAKVGQFQAARIAFDSLTRNLSQATLNTYWDLDYQGGNPVRYRRQSDLHFVIDKGSELLKGASGSSDATPTDGVFFQAALGFTAEEVGAVSTGIGDRKYRSLSNLLSVVGYYIKWSDDLTQLPDFVQNVPGLAQKRYRYRLMEVIQPAENNAVYNNSNYTTSDKMAITPSSPYSTPRQWIDASVGIKPLANGKTENASRVLAENVVALIVIPKVSEKDRASKNRIDDLVGAPSGAPGYNTMYDSRPLVAYKAQARPTSVATFYDINSGPAKERLQIHQLPPILQVTMVAVDEESGSRLQDSSITPPSWTSDLFKNYTTIDAFNKELGDPNNLVEQSLVYRLINPKKTLPTPRMNYRVFTTDVVLRNSKWSKSIN